MRGFDKVGFLLLAVALLAIASPAFAQCRGGSCSTQRPARPAAARRNAPQPAAPAGWYPGKLFSKAMGRG